MANHHRLRSSAIHSAIYSAIYSVIRSVIAGIALATLVGCATSTAPRESDGVATASESSAKALSARVGRHPTSWRLESPPPKAPHATGVETVSVPSYVVEPLAERRVAPSTQALLASGVQIRAADKERPRKRDRQNAHNGTSEPAGMVKQRAQGAISGEVPEPLAPPALTTTFGSVNFDTNSTETGGGLFIPPDPDAAAGPNHVVNVTNVVIAFHDKSTGTNVFTDSLADFFAAELPATDTFDPKVVFDPFEGRFVVVTLEQQDTADGDPANVSKILLAVSDDSNPLGTWCTTTIDGKTDIGGTDHWADYPGFSVDEEAIYITNNMFEFGGGPSGGVRLWVVDKAVGSGALYDCAGGSTSVSVAKFDPYAGAGAATTTQPAQIHGMAPAGVGTFLVSYSAITNGVVEFVQVVRIDDPLGSPTFTQEFVAVGDIEDTSPVLPDAPQSGLTDLIETNNRRALDAEWFGDSLWMTATILPEVPPPEEFAGLVDAVDGGEATAYWWQLDTSTLGTTTVTDQGKISGDDFEDDLFTFFPSVAVNGRNQVGFGYSGSASDIFAGSFYTARNPDDTAGTTQDTAQLKAGEAAYCRTFGGDNRWGDYTSAETDPVDGCFWFYNEHAMLTGTATGAGSCSGTENGRWATHYGKMCPPSPCPADMFLADIDLMGFDVRTAASRISTGKDVVVKTGASVRFEAEDLIVFFDGFSVETGGEFEAELVAAACELL